MPASRPGVGPMWADVGPSAPGRKRPIDRGSVQGKTSRRSNRRRKVQVEEAKVEAVEKAEETKTEAAAAVMADRGSVGRSAAATLPGDPGPRAGSSGRKTTIDRRSADPRSQLTVYRRRNSIGKAENWKWKRRPETPPPHHLYV